MNFLSIIQITILAVIVYQDLKYREIHLMWLLLLFSFFIVEGIGKLQAIQYFKFCAINLFILLVQFISTFTYFTLIRKRERSFINTSIGTGDIVYLITIAFGFSTLNFVITLISGLIFSLSLWIIFKFFNTKYDKLVPLAGLFSIFIIILTVWEGFSIQFNRYYDDYIIRYLYG